MISRKRPPDKYTTIKCSLKNIIKNEDDKNIILNAVTRTNRIIIHTYQFLRLFILKKYNANKCYSFNSNIKCRINNYDYSNRK